MGRVAPIPPRRQFKQTDTSASAWMGGSKKSTSVWKRLWNWFKTGMGW